jgi:hypothetical protein
MIRVMLMGITLSFSTVFLFIPDTGPDRFKEYKHEGKTITIDTYALPEDSELKTFFLFNGQKLFADTYAFLLGVHLITLSLSIVILLLESILEKNGIENYKNVAVTYTALELADLLFFILSYGEPLRGFKITWNFIKILLFGIAIGVDQYRYEQRKYR